MCVYISFLQLFPWLMFLTMSDKSQGFFILFGVGREKIKQKTNIRINELDKCSQLLLIA